MAFSGVLNFQSAGHGPVRLTAIPRWNLKPGSDYPLQSRPRLAACPDRLQAQGCRDTDRRTSVASRAMVSSRPKPRPRTASEGDERVGAVPVIYSEREHWSERNSSLRFFREHGNLLRACLASIERGRRATIRRPKRCKFPRMVRCPSIS